MNGLIGLTENAPAYAIMGNHEWWTNPDRWRRELIRSPINYIEGSVLHLSVKGVNLCLRGLGDAFTGHDKPVPFSSSCTGLKLTPAHDPYSAQRSPEEGIYFAGLRTADRSSSLSLRLTGLLQRLLRSIGTGIDLMVIKNG